MEYKDYYATLGVPRTASQDEIKKAFRKLARKHHPDVNRADPASERRFKEVNEAHAVLGDPEKRRLYDRLGADWEAFGRTGASQPGADPFAGFRTAGGRGAGSSGSEGSGGPGGFRFEYTGAAEDLAGFSEFFRTFFGGSGRASRTAERERSRRRAENDVAASEWDDLLAGMGTSGADFTQGSGTRRASAPAGAEGEVEVTLDEVLTGATRLVQVGDRRLEVRIPAGVGTGHRIRFRGQGGEDGGDLVLRVVVASHPVFDRNGADLSRDVPLSLSEALLGAEVPVETLSGRVLLRIPPGTQNGRTFRLAGQGLPRLRGDGRGDLLVRTRVVLPSELDERGRELARAFLDHVGQPDPRGSRGAAGSGRRR